MHEHDRTTPEGRDGAWAPFETGNVRSWEWWLNKVGISLLLLGVAFLFKLSWDEGWISPPLSLAFGLAVGGGLLALGLKSYEGRRSFAQVLLGGGVGVLYATGFAAHALYGLVPHPVAFAFMVAVTLLSFSLSLRQDDPSLSVIGTLGGLGTPFVLYTGAQGVGGLALYACLILSGAGAVYLFKGWRSLLYVSFIGGWTVFLAGYWGALHNTDASPDNRIALGAAVLFAWLLHWLVPAAREVLHARNPHRWPKPGPGLLLERSPVARAIIGEPGSEKAQAWTTGAAHAYILSVSAPLLALAFERRIFDLPDGAIGLAALSMAALYAVAALALWRVATGAVHHPVHHTQGLVALLLGTLGLVLILSGDALLFAVAAEAALLHLLARRLRDRFVSIEAHLLSVAAAVWLLLRLSDGPAPAAPFLNGEAAVNLSVVALLFAASRLVLPQYLGAVYRLVAHAALFVGLSAELWALPDGDDWVFLFWMLYAAALHFVSRRSPGRWTGIAAHGLAGLVGVWLLGRLISEAALSLFSVVPPAIGAGDLVNLAAILLVFGVSVLATPHERIYRLYGHAALLLWLFAALNAFSGDLVFVAWTLYAAGLHLLSRRLSAWGTVAGAHALSISVGLWLITRLGLGVVEGALGTPSDPSSLLADLAAIAAAVAISLLYPGLPRAAYRLTAVGAFSLWLASGLLPLPDGDACLLLAWSALAVALHLLATRLRDPHLAVAGHLQSLLAGFFLLGRLLAGLAEPGLVETPVLSVDAVADLAAIVILALASLVVGLGEVALYRVCAHVALLAFLWRELSVLPAGDAWVTVAWALYATGLLAYGLKEDRAGLVRGGLATLFLVAGKLLVVDLAGVEAVWRVLLFLGFGGFFLTLSYYLRSLWRPGSRGRAAGRLGVTTRGAS